MDIHAELSALVTTLNSRESSSGRLYSTLAPIYEFMFASNPDADQHFMAQYRVTRQRLPTAESVLEVGCGTGRLLPKLERTYPTVVGIDVHESMVELSRERATEATVLHADMRTADLAQSFDGVVLFEFVVSLMKTETDARELLTNCRSHLRDSGTLVCEVVEHPSTVLPGETQVFEDDSYLIERSVSGDERPSDDRLVLETDYEILEKATGRRAASTEQTTIRLFSRDKIRSLLVNAGFSDVALFEADDGLTVVARNPNSDT